MLITEIIKYLVTTRRFKLCILVLLLNFSDYMQAIYEYVTSTYYGLWDTGADRRTDERMESGGPEWDQLKSIKLRSDNDNSALALTMVETSLRFHKWGFIRIQLQYNWRNHCISPRLLQFHTFHFHAQIKLAHCKCWHWRNYVSVSPDEMPDGSRLSRGCAVRRVRDSLAAARFIRVTVDSRYVIYYFIQTAWFISCLFNGEFVRIRIEHPRLSGCSR